MHRKKVILVILSLLLMASALLAQQKDEVYNPWSLNPIRKDDQMFKKTLWFRIDLRQKANVGFFADNNELPRLLIESVKNRLIRPFKNDSLTSRMGLSEFNEHLQLPKAEPEEEEEENDAVWLKGTAKKDDKSAASASAASKGSIIAEDLSSAFGNGAPEYLPKDLYIIEVREDLIFDKRRSRMYHDIIAINIIIPADKTVTGIERVVASFSYKELVQELFRNNPKAIWFNAENSAQNMGLEDAFMLRLFDGMLTKYENPKNNTIFDMVGEGKAALNLSQKVLYDLMEYEDNLWSR